VLLKASAHGGQVVGRPQTASLVVRGRTVCSVMRYRLCSVSILISWHGSCCCVHVICVRIFSLARNRLADDTQQGGAATVRQRQRFRQGRDENVRQLSVLQRADDPVFPLCRSARDLLRRKAEVAEGEIVAIGRRIYCNCYGCYSSRRTRFLTAGRLSNPLQL